MATLHYRFANNKPWNIARVPNAIRVSCIIESQPNMRRGAVRAHKKNGDIEAFFGPWISDEPPFPNKPLDDDDPCLDLPFIPGISYLLLYAGIIQHIGYIVLSGVYYAPYDGHTDGINRGGSQYTEIKENGDIIGRVVSYPIIYPQTAYIGDYPKFGGNVVLKGSENKVIDERGEANYISPIYRDYPANIGYSAGLTCLYEWKTEYDDFGTDTMEGGKAPTSDVTDFRKLIRVFRVDANGNVSQKCPPPGENNGEKPPDPKIKNLSPQGYLTEENECPPGQTMCFSNCPDGFCCVEDCN